MQNSPDLISFVPVESRHLPLLRTWLCEPHMRQWWGDPDTELGLFRDMVEGRDSTRPFLIALDDEPVGVVQCWFVGDPQNESWIAGQPWLREMPPDTIGVDLSIGRPDLLSAGIGTAALAAFVAMLRRQGHATIIIDPDRDNTRAVRAYEKAGFRPIPGFNGRTGRFLLMQHAPMNEPT